MFCRFRRWNHSFYSFVKWQKFVNGVKYIHSQKVLEWLLLSVTENEETILIHFIQRQWKLGTKYTTTIKSIFSDTLSNLKGKWLMHVLSVEVSFSVLNKTVGRIKFKINFHEDLKKHFVSSFRVIWIMVKMFHVIKLKMCCYQLYLGGWSY